MTIAMLSLAGFPATVGFFGKLYLIQAAVDNEYAWLGVVIVIGSAISLVYYLRVIAAVWMRPASDAAAGRRAPACPAGRPAIAGGSHEADAGRRRPCAVPARRGGDAVTETDGGGRRRRRPAAACASPRSSSSPSSARSPRSRSGSGPSRSSTSPATRARRSPRWSSRPRRTRRPTAHVGSAAPRPGRDCARMRRSRSASRSAFVPPRGASRDPLGTAPNRTALRAGRGPDGAAGSLTSLPSRS